jgi:tryptophan synthase alpha chain
VTVERIQRCFARVRLEGRPALVAYLCVGDPSVEDSLACARAALDAGADMLELGVPFSDPTADGSVIAAAAYRAIHNGGSLKATLDVARKVREEHPDAPLVLFTYYNPIIAFGEERLPAAAAAAGIDALLVVDLPPEEGAELRAATARADLGFIPLIAPTSDEAREQAGFASARGFVYYVSLTGVTGANPTALDGAGQRAAELERRAGLPTVVGFGIDGEEKARMAASQGVSGVVVGTAYVRAIDEASDTAGRVEAVRALTGALRRGLEPAVGDRALS